MTRLKWLWWKFWAWLTKPWAPKAADAALEDKIPNVRARRRRGDSDLVLFLTQFMRYVNALTMAAILVSLGILWTVSQ